jgi:precorrin-2 dehydrogenase/sirohydrochlorin ferrochelatase
MTSYFPISLKLEKKRCAVVGGGQVALRKVKTLLDHQADVYIISPVLCSELVALVDSRKIRFIQRTFRAEDLNGFWLAIAATDRRDINLLVANEARKAKVLVNVVDDAENSDFIFSSYLRRGEITIAVSTSGRSPALAHKLRAKIENDFSDEYAELALLISDVRNEAKDAGLKIGGGSWQEALDVDLMIDLLKQGKNEDARNILRNKLNIEKS